MAKIIITLEDIDSENVRIEYKSDTQLPDNPHDATLGQAMSVAAMEMFNSTTKSVTLQ